MYCVSIAAASGVRNIDMGVGGSGEKGGGICEDFDWPGGRAVAVGLTRERVDVVDAVDAVDAVDRCRRQKFARVRPALPGRPNFCIT